MLPSKLCYARGRECSFTCRCCLALGSREDETEKPHTQAGLGLTGNAVETGPGKVPLVRTAGLELVLVGGVNPANLASPC